MYGVCLDSLYGNCFEIVSYKFNGKNYEYTLRFVFMKFLDCKSDNNDAGFLFIELGKIQEFLSWYILQHYDLYEGAYQPYISYMIFKKTITGSIE